ncbi:thiamine pyrophosphate-dependent enzyme [Leucobacter japonicus]|uniref:thiamine pyrophosphate-dependent enzyme n=1 Tax=Leucobacter japonicus TaxID=1461259 RepID=UPI0006A7D3C2|nr:thiamine pyrophosphate-dependent enzyme [Leucobacter japonicus]
MKRIEALEILVDRTPDAPVVATCAATSRELANVADRDNHLYLLDAMGLAISVGTGLALAVDQTAVDRVYVVEGDGSLLMNLNAAATAGYLAPEKLVIALLDNSVYASTGAIPTQATKIDLGAIAEASGLKVLRANDQESFAAALEQAAAEPGPWFIHAKISPENIPNAKLLLIDPVVHGHRFQSWLTGRI